MALTFCRFANQGLLLVHYKLMGLQRVAATASKISRDFQREFAAATAKSLRYMGDELLQPLKLRLRSASK